MAQRKSTIVLRGGIDLNDPRINHRDVKLIAKSEHSQRLAAREPGPVRIYVGDGRAQLPVDRAQQPAMPTPPCLMNATTEAGKARLAQRNVAKEDDQS